MELEQETMTVSKQVFNDVIEELELMKESLELMQDKEFMESFRRSKEQIKKGEFADWNELQSCSN